MPHISADLVRETSITTGVGALTLQGAVPGPHRTFGSVMAANDTCWMLTRHTTLAEWEICLATRQAGGTMARGAVLVSSNANALVNFSTGTKDVALVAPGARLLQLDDLLSIPVPIVGTDPPLAPSAGLRLFARSRAGRALLAYIGPSGVDNSFQPQLWGNRVAIVRPGSGTGLSSWGLTPTTAATLSHPAPSNASVGESMYRTRFSTSTTAGNASGWRDAVNTFWRGNAAGAGGFFHHFRVCSGSIGLTGGEAIVGLASATAALAGAPSALADVLGIGYDVADTNWQFMRRTGTGAVVKVDLGVAKTVLNAVLDLFLFSAPNGTSIGVRVVRQTSFSANTVLLDTAYTTDIPASATLLGRHCQVRNGTTAAAHNLDHVGTYSDSDF